MKLPSPLHDRVRYAPHPFSAYCLAYQPERHALWHAVNSNPDADLTAARWNLVWLATPALDRLPALSGQPGPAWQTVQPNVALSALVPVWSELRHAVLCEPAVFRTWLMRQRGDWLLSHCESLLPVVFRRLDEAIARRGGMDAMGAPAHVRSEKVQGNVICIDFGAGRSGGSRVAGVQV
jgi:hypothetical protein